MDVKYDYSSKWRDWQDWASLTAYNNSYTVNTAQYIPVPAVPAVPQEESTALAWLDRRVREITELAWS